MALFSTLTDDFQTGTIDSTKWVAKGSGTAVVGNQVKLQGYLQSGFNYAIAGSSVYAKLLFNPAEITSLGGTPGYVAFYVQKDFSNYVGVQFAGDGWGSIVVCNNGATTVYGGQIYYGSIAQYYLWLRIRHDGTQFSIDGSNDLTTGYSSFPLPAAPTWNPTTTMGVRFETYAAGNVWLDNVNINAGLGTGSQPLPLGVADTDTIGAPALSQSQLQPTSFKDTDVLGGAAISQPGVIIPAGITDAGLLGGPQLAQPNSPFPGSTTDTESIGAARADSSGIAPAGLANTDGVGQPTLTNSQSAAYGDDIYSRGVYGGNPNDLAPIGVVDADYVMTQVQGSTQGGATGPATGSYGAGGYGQGQYGQGIGAITPATIVDTETIAGTGGTPATTGGSGYSSGVYGDGVYSGAASNTLLPGGVYDAEQLYGNDPGDAYGYGPYGQGAYQKRNIGNTRTGYGSGSYGDGTYPGTISDPGGAAVPVPVNVPVIKVIPNPLHVLGIGPWNPVKIWHGAVNYGIGAGRAPAKPVMQLPGVQAKSITLRLDGGSEATASCEFARTDSVIVREMATDLWWLRKDPQTGHVDMLGRLNCSHNDLSRSDEGLIASSLQFQDWRIVLGNRMVLKYLDTTNAESQWKAGTPVTEIMKFAVPTDLGLDLSALDDDTLLGKTTKAFQLPPYNTIADTFTALLAASESTWEWWVDTTTDYTKPPKLSFATRRGKDRGVTLADIGTGSSPIASWQLRATSDNYANRMYFQGGTAAASGDGGGVIVAIQSEVDDVGARDAQLSDNSVLDTINTVTKKPELLIAAADKALAPLADRRPTFTIVLRTGFWRGRTHIDVGDTVRVLIRLGKELLTYSYRVSELQIDIDATGTETVTLTLGTPLASANPRSQYSPIFKLVRALKNYAPVVGS